MDNPHPYEPTITDDEVYKIDKEQSKLEAAV